MENTIYYNIIGGKLPVKDIKNLLKKSYDNKNYNKDYGDYKIDNDLTNKKTQVYYNGDKNHVVSVHRGTKDINDWLTDLKLAFGIKDKRFKEAQNLQNKINEKYSNSNHTILGHSLGSELAKEANKYADKSKTELIGLNGPTLPYDLKKDKENVYNIRSTYDPISLLNPLKNKNGNEININNSSFNPLTQHSTDSLNLLNQDEEIGRDFQ